MKSVSMASYDQLERFYLDLIRSARQDGVPCAITSGMACVAWGVSPTTQDCDVLVQPDRLESWLEILFTSQFEGCAPNFRGSLSPPLSEQWMNGGWTCHFHWNDQAFLDLFGVPPRQSRPWQAGVSGDYASILTVAEMKLTARAKDWPFATALGLKLLAGGDPEGWLFLSDVDVLTDLLSEDSVAEPLLSRRPLLGLAQTGDVRLAGALVAEQLYFQSLDRLRLQIFQRAARPYRQAVKESGLQKLDLKNQQSARLELAKRHLNPKPLADYGFEAFVEQGRAAVAAVVQPSLLDFLPDVRALYAGCFD